jgi:hypothetical protein
MQDRAERATHGPGKDAKKEDHCYPPFILIYVILLHIQSGFVGGLSRPWQLKVEMEFDCDNRQYLVV